MNTRTLRLLKPLKTVSLAFAGLLITLSFISSTATGKHLSKNEVDALLAKFDADQEPIFTRAREGKIQQYDLPPITRPMLKLEFVFN